VTRHYSTAQRVGRSAVLSMAAAGLLVLTSCGEDEPPPLEDIADTIIESVEEAESFTVLSDGDWDAAFASDPMLDDVDADAEQQEVLVHFTEGGDQVFMQIDVLDVEWDMLFLRPEAVAYMPVAAFLDLMELGAEMEGDDISSFIDAEGFREDAGDRWLIIEDIAESEMEELEISSLLSDYGFDDGPSLAEQYASEGELQEREGTSVWVYEGEDEAELVVKADSESPYFVELSYYEDDVRVTEHYSNWNDAPETEAPSEEDLMTEQELEELLMRHIIF
jgi:hypothetical protein